jgi:hypothetical protein
VHHIFRHGHSASRHHITVDFCTSLNCFYSVVVPTQVENGMKHVCKLWSRGENRHSTLPWYSFGLLLFYPFTPLTFYSLTYFSLYLYFNFLCFHRYTKVTGFASCSALGAVCGWRLWHWSCMLSRTGEMGGLDCCGGSAYSGLVWWIHVACCSDWVRLVNMFWWWIWVL